MNIIELAIAAELINHRDPYESLPPDFVASLKEFATLVRAQTLEEAAGVCDDKHDEWRFGDGEDSTSGPKDCAVAIRQLKDKT